jgi:hypothetical protein
VKKQPKKKAEKAEKTEILEAVVQGTPQNVLDWLKVSVVLEALTALEFLVSGPAADDVPDSVTSLYLQMESELTDLLVKRYRTYKAGI